MIDFVITLLELRQQVLGIQVKRGAEVSTDHHLVVSWILWQGRMLHRPGMPRCLVRVRSEYLLEALIYNIFFSHSNFDNIQRRQRTLVRTDCSTSPLPSWLYRAVAASQLAPVVATMGIKGAINFKKEPYQDGLSSGTSNELE